MGWRVMVVLVLLAARGLLNFFSTSSLPYGRRVSIVFKSYEVHQNGMECIVKSEWFWARNKGWCGSLSGQKLMLFGKLRASLIDRLLGRIWLEESEIIAQAPGEMGSKKRPFGLGRYREFFRSQMAALVKRNLPEPEAGLVLGVVMGYKSSLSKSFYEAMVSSGTVHMVVASGYNVMIVAALVISAMLVFFRRRLAVYLAILTMFFYAYLTGLEVSVVRASLMGGVLLLASTLGRKTVSWWVFTLVISLMIFFEPTVVTSISFQLSVVATFGVVILAPAVSTWLSRRRFRLAGMVEKLEIVSTMSAIAMTAPLILLHFGRGSLIAPISNVVILPLVPLLMAFGGMMIGVGLLVPFLASLAALPTYAVAHLVVLLVRFFGGAELY